MKLIKELLSELSFNLQLIFIVLKLCKLIKWSWFWVLSPIWILFILCLLHVLICLYYEEFVEDGGDF